MRMHPRTRMEVRTYTHGRTDACTHASTRELTWIAAWVQATAGSHAAPVCVLNPVDKKGGTRSVKTVKTKDAHHPHVTDSQVLCMRACVHVHAVARVRARSELPGGGVGGRAAAVDILCFSAPFIV